MAAATIVALHFPRPPLLVFFPLEPTPPLPFFGSGLLMTWTTWTVPPDELPSTGATLPFFWFLNFFGYFVCRLGPVSTAINLQTLGHGDGSLQISLHVGPNVLLQCGCSPERKAWNTSSSVIPGSRYCSSWNSWT